MTTWSPIQLAAGEKNSVFYISVEEIDVQFAGDGKIMIPGNRDPFPFAHELQALAGVSSITNDVTKTYKIIHPFFFPIFYDQS